MNAKIVRIFLLLIGVSGLISCAVTERSFEASSETFENTTDTSEDITSSTSAREDFKNNLAQVEKYVAANFAQLKADMAVGEGEYLSTLASLLAIDHSARTKFYMLTHEQFNRLVVTPTTTPKEFLANLQAEMIQASL